MFDLDAYKSVGKRKCPDGGNRSEHLRMMISIA